MQGSIYSFTLMLSLLWNQVWYSEVAWRAWAKRKQLGVFCAAQAQRSHLHTQCQDWITTRLPPDSQLCSWHIFYPETAKNIHVWGPELLRGVMTEWGPARKPPSAPMLHGMVLFPVQAQIDTYTLPPAWWYTELKPQGQWKSTLLTPAAFWHDWVLFSLE